ncbi:hypothetical protein BU14_0166s0021 [Porphyra umbilicalis]|uniref:Uncharacterized protein n=1 Tax=Porphyra umbilicalis TaxID=2786 RepID=A0A1X6P7W2_PORUM|nr:hypothetical protein BU14_0166s0021 [Porphyra umbilicalis]|eukprot:OSX76981.1 hypothetical protein BU14_0166s0021 [Porphyra umbilicalis]
MERAPSAMPVTPEAGIGSLRRTQSASPRLIRRDCDMHDGRPPHAYYVDADTGVSYWESLPGQPETKTPAAAAAAAAAAQSSSTGASVKAGAGCDIVAKPSTAGMWSPRGIVAGGGEVSPLPLDAIGTSSAHTDVHGMAVADKGH